MITKAVGHLPLPLPHPHQGSGSELPSSGPWDDVS